VTESSAAEVAEKFEAFLDKVEAGETIRVSRDGRRVARIVPDYDFMPGKEAAKIFVGLTPDPEAADAISRELELLRLEAESALDH
jgi:prevent-host-death family protein